MSQPTEDLIGTILTKLRAAEAQGLTGAEFPNTGRQRVATLATLEKEGKIRRIGKSKPARYVLSDYYSPPDLSALFLEKLETAGEKGLSAAGLSKSLPGRAEILDHLQTERKIGNLGTSKIPRYVLIEHYKPLDFAAAHIERLATPGKVTAFTLSKLEAGTSGAVRQQIPKALETLVKQKVLLLLKIGKTSYWLHVASLKPLLSESEAVVSKISGEGTEGCEEKLREAYYRVKEADGYSDIALSSLRKEMGIQLSDLHRTVLELSRRGEAVLSIGDYSLSSVEQRAAALELNGRSYLRIRLTN